MYVIFRFDLSLDILLMIRELVLNFYSNHVKPFYEVTDIGPVVLAIINTCK